MRSPSEPTSLEHVATQLAGDDGLPSPLVQLAVVVGTIVAVGVAVVHFGRSSLVPPPASTHVLALTTQRSAPPRSQPARPALALAAAVPTPAALPVSAPPAPAPSLLAPPVTPTLKPAPVEPEAARLETAPKAHGKKLHRPTAAARKHVSARPPEPATPVTTRQHRSAS
jgi:hypothetical protein